MRGSPEKFSLFGEVFEWFAEELAENEDEKSNEQSEDGKVTEIVIDPPFVNPGDEVVDYVIDPPFVPSDSF